MKAISLVRQALNAALMCMLSVYSSADIPVMEGMQTFWVGDELVHNGAAMKVQTFSFSGPPAQVLAFYESQWQQPVGTGQPGFIRNDIGEWQLISRFENGENQLVQVRLNSTGYSEGYLSTQAIDFSRNARGNSVELENELTGLPVKSGSDVVSITQSSDQNREATTWFVSNKQSIDANTRFFLDRAPGLGWQQVSQRRFGDASVLLFNAAQTQIEIAIQRNSRGVTVILANVVKLTH